MKQSGSLGIDFHRVVTCKIVAEAAEKIDAARCAVLTGGAVTSPGTQTARLLAWLAAKGSRWPTRQRATIEEALLDVQGTPLADVIERCCRSGCAWPGPRTASWSGCST